MSQRHHYVGASIYIHGQMMKKILLIIGIVLTLFSVYALLPLVLDFSMLSEYGKGYMAGNLILLFIGALMINYGLRRKRS